MSAAMDSSPHWVQDALRTMLVFRLVGFHLMRLDGCLLKWEQAMMALDTATN